MKAKAGFDTVLLSSDSERQAQDALLQLFRDTPVPDQELLANLGMFLTSKNLSRLLFFNDIYTRITGLHGVICEFGVRWGQTVALMAALRGIHEPFNRHRKIIGFDTFAGFQGVSTQDGNNPACKDGAFSVTEDYDAYLERLLVAQEAQNPISHLKKFELVKGDATESVPAYFRNHPETIVSLAIFDFDIYKPTRDALEAIRPHLCKGSILVFDELCDEVFPGETVALQEVFGLNELRIQRLPMTARVSFIEI